MVLCAGLSLISSGLPGGEADHSLRSSVRLIDAAAAPAGGPISPPDDAPATEPAPAAPPAPVTPRQYVVQPGDSVRTIARDFGVSNETIIWENDLTDPDVLQVGQKLEILPFSGLIHEVRPGDTVASIANGYEAKVEDVINVNRLSEPFALLVGQKLAVPGGYRPLPRKVVVESDGDEDGADRDPSSDEQRAASARAAARRLAQLGGTPQERFIASIAEAAVDSQLQTGVPASVTIAQAILESYWGSSRLSREANNYFGIKAQTKAGPAGVIWFNVWEVLGGRSVFKGEPFRAYDSPAQSFVDHGRFFLENGRYAAALAARGDPRQFAREINRGGYATDPSYAAKLIGLMDRYELYRFDLD